MFKERYDVSKNDLKLSTKLAELRKKSELTQEQLAVKIHVDRSSIQRWENARSRPCEEKQKILEDFFGLERGTLSDFKELKYRTKKTVPDNEKKTCSVVKCGKCSETRTNEEAKAWKDLLLFDVGDIVRDHHNLDGLLLRVTRQTFKGDRTFEGRVVSCESGLFELGTKAHDWLTASFELNKPITDFNQAPVTGTYNPIKPKHYLKNTDDLIESWFRRYPLNEFRAIMKSNIERYTFRYDQKNGEEDLKKAQMYIKRLLEYEERVQKC